MLKARSIPLAVAVALSLALHSSAGEAKAPKLTILRATYEATDGAGKADVTERVKALVREGRLAFQVSNDALGGDPTPQHAKRLKIEYTLDDKAMTLVVNEGDTVAIPPLPPPSPEQEMQKAMAALRSGDATQKEKADACRILQRSGTREAVPLLAALLPDEKLSHMARYALEPMPFPEVDEAFRAALGKTKGRELAGVIHSIGMRRDARAVPALAKCLGDADKDVAAIAAAALGRIGTPEAAKLLARNLPQVPQPAGGSVAIFDGALRCADALAADEKTKAEAIALYERVRDSKAAPFQSASAVRGIVRAKGAEGASLLAQQLRSDDFLLFAALIHLVQSELPGKEFTQAILGELPKATGDRKLMLIQALGTRRDEAAVPALTAAASAGDKPHRTAAIGALAAIGTPAVVAPLSKLIEDADADVAKAAQEAFASVPGAEVDKAIIALVEAKEPPRRALGIQLVNRRRVPGAVPVLLKATKDAEPSVRTAALQALRDLAGEADVPALLDLMAAATGPQELDAALQALMAVCRAAAKPDAVAAKITERMAAAPPNVKGALLRSLGALGGPAALKAVRAATADPDDQVKRAAVRSLSEWKDADAAKELLDLAKSLPNDTDKLLCLRGVLSLAGRQAIGAPERLAMCKQAAPLITRDEERKLLLSSLASIQTPEAMAEIVPFLDNDAIKQEASMAALNLAEALLRGRQSAPIAAKLIPPLQQVMDAAASPELANRARVLLQKAKSAAGKK